MAMTFSITVDGKQKPDVCIPTHTCLLLRVKFAFEEAEPHVMGGSLLSLLRVCREKVSQIPAARKHGTLLIREEETFLTTYFVSGQDGSPVLYVTFLCEPSKQPHETAFCMYRGPAAILRVGYVPMISQVAGS